MSNYRGHMQRLFFILFFIIFYSVDVVSAPRNDVRVQGGILDLSQHDFTRNELVPLSGEWQFYWNSFVTKEEIVQQDFTLIEVPSEWNRSSAKNTAQPYDTRGFASFRMKLLLPEGSRANYSVRMPAVDVPYRLYANGILLFESGSVGKTEKDSYVCFYAPVFREIQNVKEVEFILHVSNYRYPRPGIRDAILFGSRDAIAAYSEQSIVTNIFLISAILFLALYHLMIFLLRRSDRSPLYFAIICLCLLCRLLITSEGYLYRFPFFTWSLGTPLEYLSIYVASIAVTLYARSLFPDEINKIFVYYMGAVVAFFSAIVVFTPVMFYPRTFIYYELCVGVAILYLFFTLIRAIVHKREGAIIFITGLAVFFITMIADTMYTYRFTYSGYFMPLGLYIFSFAQAFLLSIKYNRAFSAIEALKSNLEVTVFERTVELKKQSESLAYSNMMLEREILLARRMQDQSIPVRVPGDFISTYYRSMLQLGGDFFDFLNFKDDQKTGVFLGDVSGHGVPAAMITTMVKTILLQAEARKENPCDLLNYINNVLYENTGGYFCSAVYCIYDKSNRVLLYSLAGHERPLIISESGVRALEGKKSVPLGVFDEEALRKADKNYISSVEMLPSGCKLLLYTDGLVEAASPDGIHFIDAGFNDFLFENRSLAAKEFTKKLTEKLFAHRGQDTFDDDVCFVCLDIE